MAVLSKRPVVERMADAKLKQIERRRVPRCFYLNREDFAEFEATKPRTVEAMFALGGNPPAPITCLAFDGIAVRPSAATKPNRYGVIYSTLFCCVGTGVSVPLA